MTNLRLYRPQTDGKIGGLKTHDDELGRFGTINESTDFEKSNFWTRKTAVPSTVFRTKKVPNWIRKGKPGRIEIYING